MFRRAPKRSPATVGVVSVGTESRRAAPSRVAVLLVMCVGYFLVLLDVTIVNVALPTIGRRLHAGSAGCNGSSTATPSPWPVSCSPVGPSVTCMAISASCSAG